MATTHEELISLANPLIDFMNENEFNYLFISGKDGNCGRWLNGKVDEVHGMIYALAEKHPQFRSILEEVVKDLKELGK